MIASYLAKITSREEIISFKTSTGKWLIRVMQTIVTHCYKQKSQQLVNKMPKAKSRFDCIPVVRKRYRQDMKIMFYDF